MVLIWSRGSRDWSCDFCGYDLISEGGSQRASHYPNNYEMSSFPNVKLNLIKSMWVHIPNIMYEKQVIRHLG